jgi:hypothetical protein
MGAEGSKGWERKTPRPTNRSKRFGSAQLNMHGAGRAMQLRGPAGINREGPRLLQDSLPYRAPRSSDK